MEAFWNDLSERARAGKLSKDEDRFFKRLVKSLGYLSANPRHNSLESHEIDALTQKFTESRFFNRSSRTRRQRQAEYSGRMGRTKEILPFLELSHTQRIRSAGPISA